MSALLTDWALAFGLEVGLRELVAVSYAVLIVMWVAWHRFGRAD